MAHLKSVHEAAALKPTWQSWHVKINADEKNWSACLPACLPSRRMQTQGRTAKARCGGVAKNRAMTHPGPQAAGLSRANPQANLRQKYGQIWLIRENNDQRKRQGASACTVGAAILIFGGFWKCLKSFCFSLQAIITWNIFSTFSLGLFVYSNTNGDHIVQRLCSPSLWEHHSSCNMTPWSRGEAGNSPGREQGGFPGPALQGPLWKHVQWGPSQSEGRVAERGWLCTRGPGWAVQTLYNHQLSCFPCNHVRLISGTTGNACGLEWSANLHISLFRTFPDLAHHQRKKKFTPHQQPGTGNLSQSRAISWGYVYRKFPEETTGAQRS